MKSITETLAVAIASAGGVSSNSSVSTTISRAPPPQPWGTRFLDTIRLLSPRTWWGIAINAEKSPFAPPLDWTPLREGLIGLCLPWLVSVVCFVLVSASEQPPQQQRHQALAFSRIFLASPWAWYCLWDNIGLPFRQLLRVGIQNRRLRTQPLPEAVDTMWDLHSQERVVRSRRYDLFLPTLNATTTNTTLPIHNNPQRAILFLPGAAVPTIAYAPIAARLANAGFVVAVPSMEPMRLALHHLGAEWSGIQRILKHVERRLGPSRPVRWTLAGHSMGSFAAMQLFVAVLQHKHQNNKNKKSKNPPSPLFSNQLLLWGTMYAPAYATEWLSQVPGVELLLIQGTNDGLVAMTASSKEEFETNYLPQRYHKVLLEGGTHHGFASYKSPMPDQPNDMPRQEQQDRACKESIAFLQQHKEGY